MVDGMALSPRLQAVLDFVGGYIEPCADLINEETIILPIKILADIGTDHAYLPIAAMQQRLCSAAIACDLHPGPLSIANHNIREAGLADKIQTRLGDGLSPLSPGEASCIVIAGMGGMRIWGILLEGMAQARQAEGLILQPQHDIVLLRKNLHGAGFEIQDERIVREMVAGREHFYTVVAARYTSGAFLWSDREYFLGKYLIEKGGADFNAFVEREREKIHAYLSQIRDSKSLCDARKRLEWLD